MSNSWTKVAAGARLLACTVAKQSAEDAAVVAQRASHHGLDLSVRARRGVMAVAPDHLWNLGTYMDPAATTADSVDVDAAPAEPSSSPYESQWRRKQAKVQEKQKAAPPVDHVRRVEETVDITPQAAPAIPNPYLLHAKNPEELNVASDSTSTDTDTTAAAEAIDENTITNQPPQAAPLDSRLEQAMESSETNIRASPGNLDDGAVGDRLAEGRAVPSTRIGRAVGFASLGAGLVWGTASEMASRLVGTSSDNSGSAVTSNANADRLAATLCRMRGAALKLGQMLSIQDETLLPPALTRALKQVRQGADAMPHYQLANQLESQLGPDWRDRFETFEDLPFAAASIGQVHRATIRENDGTLHDVVVKVQYPGVASSIESDLRNMGMLVTMTGLAPQGLFIENVMRVGREELKVECNYINEMANQQAFQELVANDPILQENRFVVPRVYEDVTTEQIIVSGYSPGGTIDKVSHLAQEERNRIAHTILYLTMQELFIWRLMQTDPNWGNFLYDVGTQQTTLIDFGATREYPKSFVDGYLRIVWASANQDETTLLEQSHRMGFLTGEENGEMIEAHILSGYTVGEPFAVNERPFDFEGSRISTRMGQHTSVFLQHRLTPPPEEVYTLHRKLAGAYMLCIKLGAVISCRDLLKDVVRNYKFEDGLPHPMDNISK